MSRPQDYSTAAANGTGQFRIRRAFLLPLGLLLTLSVALLIVTLLQGQSTGKIIVLSALIIPVAGIFLESATRSAEIGSEAITIHKFLRNRSLRYDEVTEVEAVVVKKRAFLSISSEAHFLIISNAYADFPVMVRSLLSHVPEETVTEQAQKMAADPPVKSSDIVSCWIAAALMALILAVQLSGRL
jgi:hypothetical protein